MKIVAIVAIGLQQSCELDMDRAYGEIEGKYWPEEALPLSAS